MKFIDKILGEGWNVKKQVALYSGLGAALIILYKLFGVIPVIVAFGLFMVYIASRLFSGNDGNGAD